MSTPLKSESAEKNLVDSVQVAIHRVSHADAENLYDLLQLNAKTWLERCGIESYWELLAWVTYHGSFVAHIPSGVMFISHWESGLTVRVHPVIWGKQYCLSPGFSLEVLRQFNKACYTERIEVLVPIEAPKSLGKWALKTGFTHEGLLRKCSLWKHQPTDADLYSITVKEME